MVQKGFLEEVRGLLERGYSPQLNSFRAVGYREMSDHLTQNSTLAEAVARTKKSTRAFAKRQLTWFRGLAEVEWMDLSVLGQSEAVERVCSLVRERRVHD
jgi:tRNA dimethylallyltransferase